MIDFKKGDRVKVDLPDYNWPVYAEVVKVGKDTVLCCDEEGWIFKANKSIVNFD